MKKYITGILCIIVIFVVKESRASGCANTYMDVEIIDIISPPREKGSDFHCKLKVKIKKIHEDDSDPIFKQTLNWAIQINFKLKNRSLKKVIRKGNTVIVSVTQCGMHLSELDLDPSIWDSTILRENVDFSKHKPVLFQKSSRYGYKDYNDAIVIDPQYIEALPFLDTGIAAVKGDYGWEYINYFGNEVITPYVVNDRPDAFQEGLARYKIQPGNIHNKTYYIGFMNQKGEAVIEAEYRYAYPFSEGLAAVCVDNCEINDKSSSGKEELPAFSGTWGYIDKKGKMVIKPYFSEISSFKNGRAVVYTEKGKRVVINRDGEIIE